MKTFTTQMVHVLFPGGSSLLVGMIVGALCLTTSCQSIQQKRPEPVTVTQILDMTKAGMPAQDIISKIKESGTVYRMKASELAALKDKGVANDVIDYMQETYINAVLNDQSNRDWVYGADGFWYGGYPYGWPFFEQFINPEPMAVGDQERGERSR